MLSPTARQAVLAYLTETLPIECFGVIRITESARYYIRAFWQDGRRFYDILVVGLDGLPVRSMDCINPRQALNYARALTGLGTRKTT